MKIAILSFYRGHLERGAENWVTNFANRLAEKNEVTVYQNGKKSKKDKFETVVTDININWRSPDSRGTFPRRLFVDYWSRLILSFTLRISPRLFKNSYDVIIPIDGGWQPALVRLISLFKSEKMVIVGHAGKGWDERNNIYSFPDCFVGLSSFARDWAKKINPFIKTTYIPNGVDQNKFTPKGRKAELPLEPPIFLLVAAPEKGKGLDKAIKAVSKLKKGSLLILGKGHEEDKFRKMGKKILGKRFMLTSIPFEKIDRYYRAADIFTAPSSQYYSFELVILEAMACNIPVVANDDKIRKEIVGKGGILVDPTDTDAYAKALEKTLNTNWGNKPRKQAEKFSWNNVVDQYINLFNEITNK